MLSLQEPEADSGKVTLMCLFHDLAEARTGDRNYVNKRYVEVHEDRATEDLARNLPFGPEIVSLADEFNKGESPEASISKDADQLDMILELKEQQDLGNRYAEEWLYYALKRLITKNGKKMAQEILKTDSTEWWFDKRTDFWVNKLENTQNIKK